MNLKHPALFITSFICSTVFTNPVLADVQIDKNHVLLGENPIEPLLASAQPPSGMRLRMRSESPIRVVPGPELYEHEFEVGQVIVFETYRTVYTSFDQLPDKAEFLKKKFLREGKAVHYSSLLEFPESWENFKKFLEEQKPSYEVGPAFSPSECIPPPVIGFKLEFVKESNLGSKGELKQKIIRVIFEDARYSGKSESESESES